MSTNSDFCYEDSEIDALSTPFDHNPELKNHIELLKKDDIEKSLLDNIDVEDQIQIANIKKDGSEFSSINTDTEQ
eukprot:CAMPEP_0116882426 /NCGR_PEP_ID=MMETSP0463-20121206/14650_1 /TAXON_ID=181622 /ORGANISM="Strombidinopsis sp, Strain SopsisLIS2011" /LENGTH=74 /DNA_ID=CAMNT_0004535583 /DNA_START=2027 /DNA_END=2251 /DNA_ORIENTATION=-